MKNPWLEIPVFDYESHMFEVGQSHILGLLTQQALKRYQPETFFLPGCASGNGLEFIDNSVTSQVFALDINPDYLRIAELKYRHLIPKFHAICCNLEIDKLAVKNIDLAFCGLVLEYVNPSIVLPKIINTLKSDGNLVIVIQKNNNASFVSKTKYTSLQKLSQIAEDLAPEEIDAICRQQGLLKIHSDEVPVNDNKAFLVMDYKKCEPVR